MNELIIQQDIYNLYHYETGKDVPSIVGSSTNEYVTWLENKLLTLNK